MSKSERATKIFFWLAFGAFLAMSVPHVAWVFRFYEPKHDGYDAAWWAVSYGVAVSVDLLICWLSYTRSEQQSAKSDSFITWTFILLLAILSWYCNWIFAESMIGANVWSISLGFGWTVGSLTPLITSAIPMFMIAYTYMSKKIIGAKPHVKSVEELQQELNDLRQKVTLKQQLSTLKNQQNASWVAGKLQMVQDAFSQEKQATMQLETDQKSEQSTDELDLEGVVPVSENVAESLSANEEDSEEMFEENPQPTLSMIEQAMYDALLKNPQEFEALQQQARALSIDDFTALLRQKYSRYASYVTPARVANVMQFIDHQIGETVQEIDAEIETVSEEGSGRKYLMTFEEASQYTGYAISTLRKQLKAGEIEANKAGEKLKVSSLKIRTGITAKMPVVTPEKVLATNGHH